MSSENAFDVLKRPIIFAHRGASGYEYENTLPAFRKGIELGADGLETDCWLLKDGNIVLHHDKSIRTPELETPLNISKLTLEEVKEINLPNREKIPTIQEFFDNFADKTSKEGVPIIFSIDLQDIKVGAALVPVIEKYGLTERVVLCGNSFVHLKRVRKINDKVKLVASNMQDIIKKESFAPGSKAKTLNIYAFNIQAEFFEENMKKVLDDENIKCFIWDLHTEENLRKYLKYKPDAIYSNYPDLAVKVNNELNN
ncbi:MAG: glycerophosphodiester phosphodiesterase [Promethearchaeota archaeon]